MSSFTRAMAACVPLATSLHPARFKVRCSRQTAAQVCYQSRRMSFPRCRELLDHSLSSPSRERLHMHAGCFIVTRSFAINCDSNYTGTVRFCVVKVHMHGGRLHVLDDLSRLGQVLQKLLHGHLVVPLAYPMYTPCDYLLSHAIAMRGWILQPLSSVSTEHSKCRTGCLATRGLQGRHFTSLHAAG